MKNVDYDEEADTISVDISTKKADRTIEITEHILVDITSDGQVSGLEILDASEEISKIFARAVPKSEIRQLLCQIKQEPNNEYLIQFNSLKKKQVANGLFPIYKSPLIS
jgi:uncharacterized protein YuzE